MITMGKHRSHSSYMYAVGFAIGPLIGGYLVAVLFRWGFAIKSVVFHHLSLLQS
jgi:MFS family permease